jgi:hypothetical protein
MALLLSLCLALWFVTTHRYALRKPRGVPLGSLIRIGHTSRISARTRTAVSWVHMFVSDGKHARRHICPSHQIGPPENNTRVQGLGASPVDGQHCRTSSGYRQQHAPAVPPHRHLSRLLGQCLPVPRYDMLRAGTQPSTSDHGRAPWRLGLVRQGSWPPLSSPGAQHATKGEYSQDITSLRRRALDRSRSVVFLVAREPGDCLVRKRASRGPCLQERYRDTGPEWCD